MLAIFYMEDNMIVMKFGGSSLGSVEAFRKVARIVGTFLDRTPIVVVSAMAGVTDLLLSLMDEVSKGGESVVEGMLEKIHSIHQTALVGLLTEGGDPKLQTEMELLLENLTEMVLAPVVNEESLAVHADEVVSFGERLSSILLAVALRAEGIKARPFDSRQFVFTDDKHGAARIDTVRTYMAADAVLRPYAEDVGVPVVTGYIGSAPDGSTTTLGRDSSDTTATSLGGALKVTEVWLWKEGVDGAMTAHPDLYPAPALISEMIYDEAAEMSFFGANVLHSSAMIPVIELGIPVRIRNTSKPEAPGTLISSTAELPAEGVRAVVAKRKQAIVSIEGKGMAGIAGFAAKVFGVAERLDVSIRMISQASAEQSICMVCDAAEARRLAGELKLVLQEQIEHGSIERVDVRKGVAIIAVIGEGMCGRIGVAGKLFSSMARLEINILAIAQGSSERNISFVIEEEPDMEHAVFRIVEDFGLYGPETGKEESDE
ncbi:MAG: aspartate kinase [Patescibacteria group bacterium]|nr:aspartate kinase [Patescibacteria group bacterium]